MEEATEYCHQDSERHLSVVRGGPIFVLNHVGPMTSVPDFKASLLQELSDLEAELVLNDDFDEELSVADLKVFSEEELVEMALKEEIEHDSGKEESLQKHGKAIFTGDDVLNINKEIPCSKTATNESSYLESSASLNDTRLVICATDNSEKKAQRKTSKKRGRFFDRTTRAAELESSYFDKVKQLAKIKKRQDEDKLAARLHSFSGDSKSMDEETMAIDKIETMQSLNLRSITSSPKVKCLTSEALVPVFYPETVLCIEIYHPSTSKKTQEFLVLESQTLTELRDNIYCLTDKLMQAAEKHDPSGYFLIEESFCNDLRSPSATDYSEPIFNWLTLSADEAAKKWEYIMSGELKKKHKELLGSFDTSSLPNFRAVDMDKTRFCDLRFRLGAGYLYCHQGNCRHSMVFRDMRLMNAEDSWNRAEYPILTFQIRPRHRKCCVCQIYEAEKMTVGDKWAPDSPSFFCIKCYFLLHYKQDNTLLYPHTVYDYFHE